MFKAIYSILQLTWGMIQSLLGLFYLLTEGRGKEHFWFHGAYVTRWSHSGGLSLGMFIFIGDPLMNNGEQYAYLTHEYGHSIQSLIFGPLYLLIVGISSSKWAAKYNGEMLRQGISYFSVFPENNANVLGEKITGIKVPEHIPSEMFEVHDSFALELGGVSQWVTIRGTDASNPVLLVIHGGPGSTLTGLSYTYQKPWEQHYTVVNWDQRCSGRTASLSGKTSPVQLTVDIILNDALELTDYLRERFHKEKIIILGHSWGTLLGARLALKHPDKYACYISTGTMVAGRRADKYQYEFFEKRFTEACDQKKLAKLRTIDGYWAEEPFDEEKALAMNKILIEEGFSSTRANDFVSAMKVEIIPMLKSPDYRLKDNLNLFGYKAYPYVLQTEMPAFDVEKLGCRYEIPIYYINGDTDIQTPYELAKEYYEKTVAPDKDFFTLSNCAHCWDLDAPEQMAEVMCSSLPERIKRYL